MENELFFILSHEKLMDSDPIASSAQGDKHIQLHGCQILLQWSHYI